MLGIKQKGVDFDALDGQPSRIMVLTHCPTRGSAPRTQFMALISRALDAEGRKQTLQATSPDELWNALVRE